MTKRRWLRRLGLVALLSGAPWVFAASESSSALLHSLAAFPRYQAAAISPDAHWLAWVQRTADEQNPVALGAAVFVRPVGGKGTDIPVSAVSTGTQPKGALADEEWIAWSPDSQSLAFLSDAGSPGQRQLYIENIATRSVRQLTHVKGDLTTPSWSPDGRTLAFLFTENSQRQAGPMAAVQQPTGVIDEQVLEQRIALVDVTTTDLKIISPPDLYVYEYDWSPDGKSFAVTAAHGSGDNNWYIAKLYTIGEVGGEAHEVFVPSRQIGVPRWSPDGRQIAFVTGLMSDEGIASGEIYVVAADGGAARNLTPDLDGSVYWFAWPKAEKHADSTSLSIAEALDGGSAIGTVDTRTRRVHVEWKAPETVLGPAEFARGISIAQDGKTTALIRESFNTPPTLWVGAIGNWRLEVGSREAPPKLWGAAESVRWGSDGFEVQGWLVPPAVVEPGRKYPMVVWVHGGPAWLTAPSWPSQLDDTSRILLLAARGYYIFFPNPRGSTGFGERFKQANIKDFGGGDLRDILAGVRRVVETRPVDDSRVGLTGWSYGGFMTMWTLTQTNRFRAAVTGAGLANWLSYYGENGIDEWMLPYFGASVYDDPAVYAKSSPMNFIKNVRTPTLVIVGDSDVECPPPQSYEYWHALKTLGVKTQLVIYPHEGHGFEDPAHIADMLDRMTAWFDDNMPAASTPTAH
jgi:dipeptidyl aminopeptidase/acylaminoacyl peptidase